ncbi:multidrug resistance protein, MATE family [Variovorax sp. OK605]|uniref:MATE family efflux transporter n=1 Tax=unclassified Variovorax TaxID=663243 RepID=UPI0008BA32C2|nr:MULTISPECIES: MATE family efflux transporter [unclassified Variovorax]SEJ67304.1 multidrug resistance protein, MATE family [Variovorax sp. OK202]SFC76209.1 multidrug resistance protein, MATE family [Variovorax sp. OK212]SFO61289.1 multidrug resistance protein, MATE family [Variovorax sp. OK605]
MAGERSLIARHAGTVLVGQLAVMAFGVTDTIIAGRYSEHALAALSVGAAVFVSVYVSLMGVLQALLPVWAELHGGGRGAEVGRSVRQSLYLAGIAVVAGMAVLLSPGAVLRFTQVPPEMRGEVEAYLVVLAFGLAPALLFRLFSTLNQSLGKPQLVTWLQLGSLFVKLPLSIWFTFGGAGLPAMGLVGCGWATLCVNWAMLGCAVWLLRSSPFYRGYRLWQRIEPPDWHTIRQFARMGVPGGLAVLVEVTSFTLMALFIARLGTVAAAAHQIAANLLAVAYMVPLSLAIATSARVSFWLGARDAAKARHACRLGFELTVLCALLFAAAMLTLRFQLANVYSDNPAVIALAATLLLVVAAYHLADALQTLCVFVLRCYRVTLAPLVIYCTMLWGIGLGGSYLLAYRGLGPWPAMQSPLAFWIMSAGALALAALLFGTLLRWTMAQRAR